MDTDLPIGIDSFRKIREEGKYYVDKTLMISDFNRYKVEVALITRPRRFGKTLNMTMLREFYDITADSRAIFDGLAIMDTEYADQINSRPVIFFSFKDSTFSQLNNIRIYTVTDDRYSRHFGFTENETRELLSLRSLELDGPVKQQYDGYLIGSAELYNPWSILNYADTGVLENYWVNTSTNALVRDAIADADEFFFKNFDKLIKDGTAEVCADLTCSFVELKHNDSLWGLLINSGYLTVVERTDAIFMTVRVPNGEVMSEFIKIVSDRARVSSQDLQKMFSYLFRKDMDGFVDIYRQLVISCTSYFDARENAYHMLFLGMCISLRDIYRISSNIESGHGRSDIRMESLSDDRPHIVIEFKQGEDIEALKVEALRQILDNRYYEGLCGEVLCMGVAHDKKRCSLAHETITGGGTIRK